MALNDRQKRFCEEFIKDLNATKAYSRAYPNASEKAARTNASRLLANDNILSHISELKEARAERTQITQDMVLKRIADVAFAHLGLYATWDEQGRLTLKEKELLTEGELAGIQSLQTVPVSDGDGGLLGYNQKITLRDNLKALELLAKHLGMLDGSGSDSGNSKANTESILGALRNLGKGRGKGRAE